MERWPQVDRGVRRRLLVELRRRQRVEQAELTPDARVRRLVEMRKLADWFRPRLPAQNRSTDEPAELWIELMRRWRSAGRRHPS